MQGSLGKHLLIYLLTCIFTTYAFADESIRQIEIDAPSPIQELLQKHLQIIKWRDNPRITSAEWQRLYLATPKDIKNLLATEGFFSPRITPALNQENGVTVASFRVDPGIPTLIKHVDIQFTGDITLQDEKESLNMQSLRDHWSLKAGTQFSQENWDDAKRGLLIHLLIERYPNAAITNSKAIIDPTNNSADLHVEVDSGKIIRFGHLSIKGLERYPASVVENLNPIKPGSFYNQSQLLTFQSRLQESGYFSSSEVTADTKTTDPSDNTPQLAPILVTIKENKSIKVGVGAGYSTNTGARTQLTLDDLNLFNQGWRMSNSLKVEQRSQAITSQIRLPTTQEGYRDSMNAAINHITLEGQATTTTQAGIKRAWGGRKREQYVGANLLTERVSLDGADASSNYAATVSYGITLRRTDNELNPTRGYLFNAQFTTAPINQLSEGAFIQSYVKVQAYYPITSSTQLISRAEIGMVNGKNSAPQTYLFRAGGDQSVRGYAYQSLGVQEGDAIVGGRYLATGSIEVIQWLTQNWGGLYFLILVMPLIVRKT